MYQLSLCIFLSIPHVDETCLVLGVLTRLKFFRAYRLDESSLGAFICAYIVWIEVTWSAFACVYCMDRSDLKCFCLCILHG